MADRSRRRVFRLGVNIHPDQRRRGNSDLADPVYGESRPRLRIGLPLIVIVFQARLLGFVLPDSPRSTDSGKESRDFFEK